MDNPVRRGVAPYYLDYRLIQGGFWGCCECENVLKLKVTKSRNGNILFLSYLRGLSLRLVILGNITQNAQEDERAPEEANDLNKK